MAIGCVIAYWSSLFFMLYCVYSNNSSVLLNTVFLSHWSYICLVGFLIFDFFMSIRPSCVMLLLVSHPSDYFWVICSFSLSLSFTTLCQLLTKPFGTFFNLPSTILPFYYCPPFLSQALYPHFLPACSCSSFFRWFPSTWVNHIHHPFILSTLFSAPPHGFQDPISSLKIPSL